MKKLLAALCVLTLAIACLLVLPTRAEAASYTEGNYTYTVYNGEATITEYTGSGGNITIPSTFGDSSVTTIGAHAFSNCDRLTSVTIPGSVTTIGEYAFSECTSLTTVTIGNSVTTIGDYAFCDCTNLTGIWVADGNAKYCSDAQGVLFDKNKTELIQAPGKIVGNYVIPDSVTSIGSSAFYNCSSLTTVTIPGSVTTIGIHAFAWCTGLTSVTIPDSVTAIGDRAFYACSNLSAVTIPDSVTTIGKYAFSDCTSLTTVTIPDSVTAIGEYAFRDCTGLTSVTIPDGVTSIDSYAFSGCTGLTSVTIPDSVTSIDSYAFSGCTGLTSVTIPDSVTAIGNYAFRNCTGLTSVTIPDSVTSIGYSAFSGCEIKKLIIAEGSKTVTYIMVLCEASLQEIVIPDSVTAIEDSIFRSCTNLTSVTIGDSVPTIGNHAFDGCTGLTSVAIGNSVTSIGYSAFSGCTSLTSVTIPDSVTSIGSSAFSGCTGLTSVTIPDSVTAIGHSAFRNCTGLTTVTIPDSVTAIEIYAFRNCTGLTTVTIPDSVTEIASEAFYGCTSLTKVYYAGSQAAWNRISIGTGNTYLKGATIQCTHVHDYTVFPPVIVDPTCMEAGYIEYTCVYGEKHAEPIPALGHEMQANQVAPTCEEQGYTEHVCVRCKEKTLTNWVAPLGHKMGENGIVVQPTCEAQGYTEYSCICCDEKSKAEFVNALGHEFTGSTRQTVAPTCTEEGVTETDCIRCSTGKKKGIVPALGHNMVKVEAKDPTCTDSGNSVGTQCSRCKMYGVQPTVIPALNHSFTDYKSNNNATCTADGTETAKCDRCTKTHTRTEAGSAKGHDHKLTAVAPPTCVNKGYTTYTCHCGDIYVAYVVALNHSFTNYKSNGDATCTADGTETAKCDRCTETHTRTETNSKLGHSFTQYTSDNNATCTKDGMETAKCDRCTETHTRTEAGSAKGHKHEAKVTPPTCVNKGYTTYTCHCGDTYVADYVAVLNHSFTEYMSNGDATCTADGTETAKCDRCTETHTRTKAGSAKGHKHEAKVTPPTCLDKGYTTYTCHCGDTYVADYVDALGHKYANGSCANCGDTPAGAKITKQPTNAAAPDGTQVKTTLTATGDGLKYAWYFRNAGVTTWSKSSLTGNSYYVTMKATTKGRQVYCVVTDQYGNTVKSDVVTLHMGNSAKITVQPKNAYAANGTQVKTTLTATGDGLKYAWYFRNAGATTWSKSSLTGNSYYVTMKSTTEGRQVYCVVTDKYGNSVKSNVVTLSMGNPLKITQQPANVAVANGETAKTTVIATGDGLQYTWYFKDMGKNGYSKSSITTNTYSAQMNSWRSGRLVYCVVTDQYGNSVESVVAELSMRTPLKITKQPVNAATPSGVTAKTSVVATGDSLTYAWYFKDSGKTEYSKSSITTNTYSAQMNSWRSGRKVYCVVTDKYGNSVKSNVVTLYMGNPAKITTQPKTVTVANGKQAKTTIKASGSGLKYTWYFKNAGATTWSKSSLTGNSYYVTMKATTKNRQVYCVVTDKYGISVKSNVVTLKMK